MLDVGKHLIWLLSALPMFFEGEEDAVPWVEAGRTPAPCASAPEQGWGVAGFLKAPLFVVSNTITTAAYGPGRAATGSAISMPTGDDTGRVTWKQWQRDRRALCLLVPTAAPPLQPSNGEGHRAAWCGPTSTPSHGPCLVCFVQTLYTPQHTHMLHGCSGLSRGGNTLQITLEAQTLDVLPGCNGPDPLLPPSGSM